MSGGELSGETFASPSLNPYGNDSTNNEIPMVLAAAAAAITASTSISNSSLLVSANFINNQGLNNETLTTGQTIVSNNLQVNNEVFSIVDSNQGLLSIDPRTNDDRTTSFIDSKFNFRKFKISLNLLLIKTKS